MADLISAEDLAEAAVPVAAALICAVEDHDVETSHAILSAATVAELHALAVVLAAMVPADRGVASLLAEEKPVEEPVLINDPSEWTEEQLAQAHEDWLRIRRANGYPPAWVALGETEYQHRRAARSAYLTEINARGCAVSSAKQRSAAS